MKQFLRTDYFMLNISAFGAKIGITRFIPLIVNDSAAIKEGSLSEEEKNLYRAIFYRRTMTNSMLNEVKEIKANAEKTNKNGIPEVPMLFFVSNGEGTGWDKDEWVEIQTSYIEKRDKNKIIKLNSGHYIHDIEYEKIAEKSIEFIDNL